MTASALHARTQEELTHVLDLRRRWANHGYVPLYLDPKRIEQVAIDRVTLAP